MCKERKYLIDSEIRVIDGNTLYPLYLDGNCVYLENNINFFTSFLANVDKLGFCISESITNPRFFMKGITISVNPDNRIFFVKPKEMETEVFLAYQRAFFKWMKEIKLVKIISEILDSPEVTYESDDNRFFV